jgi:predicted RNA-binding Zn-ribbon protein involved in translation (DUF1610 family)
LPRIASVSATILCNGCGLQVPVPAGHSAARLRCPECGVMSEIPDAVRAKAAAKVESAPSAAPLPGASGIQADATTTEQALSWDEPAAPATSTPAMEHAFSAAAPGPGLDKAPSRSPAKPKRIFSCPTCGERVRAPLGKRRKAWRCPICGGPAPEVAMAPAALPPPRPLPPPEPEFQHGSHDEEDNNPYPVDRPKERKCPGCGKTLAVEVVLCVTCGYHLSAGAKVGRSFEPLRRHWEAGLPLRHRLLIFLALQIGGLALFWSFAQPEDDLLIFAISWLVYVLLTSFVLGTFDRLDVSRNEKGQARVQRRWRICFLPRPAWRIPWRDYEGVVTGRTREGGCLAWLVILGLLPLGVLPAILWWYYFMHRDAHFLALARDHGCPDLILYRGLSEQRVEDMATVLQDATALPWRKA